MKRLSRVPRRLPFAASVVVSGLALAAAQPVPFTPAGPPAATMATPPPPAPDFAAVESQFVLPDGFSLRLVAAEPNIVNPMTMAVDEAGSLYVTDSHTYRYGPEGSPFSPATNPIKRIDFGPDGRATRVTTVAEGFANPVMGIAVHDGKLYATCLNELFVMDVGPDGRLIHRKLLVKDGAEPWNPFGMYRVIVGPDGKVWLSIGDHPATAPATLTGTDRRTVRLSGQSGGMVRCNLDGTGLEMIVEGFRAPFAFDIDPWGHLWHISNGEGSPNIYVHVIPGMDYGFRSRKNASYTWLAGKSPLAPPVRDMGPGANTSALHYYGSMFPREYWGSIFVANWGNHGANPTNRNIKRFLRQKGSAETYGDAESDLLEAPGIFLTSTDPMFRPTSIVMAPDGGLYVSDWHGRDDENNRTGRIFKIVYSGSGRLETSPVPTARTVARMAPAQLVMRLADPNPFSRELAQRSLVRAGEAALADLGQVVMEGDAFAAANAVWTLTRMNTPAAAKTMAFGLKHPDARVRAHAMRQLRQVAGQPLGGMADTTVKASAHLSEQELRALAELALQDPSGEVRVEAALSLITPAAIGQGLIAALNAAQGLRVQYQIGFELGRRGDRASLEKLRASADPTAQRVALIAADTARYKKTALAAVVADWDLRVTDQDRAEKLLAQARAAKQPLQDPSDKLIVLESLEDHPPAEPPIAFLISALQDDDRLVVAAALRAVCRSGVNSAEVTAATVCVLQSTRYVPSQVEALHTLGSFADPAAPDVWRPWLESPSKVIVVGALRALRQRERKPRFIEALWPAIDAAAQRGPEFADEAWFAASRLGVPSAQLARLAPRPKAPGDKEQLAQAVLVRLKRASAAQGRFAFTTSSCAACHSVRPSELGFGLGPKLADVGANAQPQYLIESILEPSKVIKTGFQLESIETKDGRVLSGQVEANEQRLVVRTLGAEPVTISLSEVKSRTVSPVSPMPEGLEANMTVGELADLTAYLLSLKGD